MHHEQLLRRAAPTAAAVLACVVLGSIAFGIAEAPSAGRNPQIWTCSYIASTPQGPLQITAKFQVFGNELAEIETIPKALNFTEKYKILENTDADIVAAISIAKLGDFPPPGIGAVVIIIAKQNGLFQQSGAILGLQTGPPTLGRCENQ
jgi:hypothetical protein